MDAETNDILARGWQLLNGGDRDGAEQLFVLASERTPEETGPWNGLGACAFEAGDVAASMEYYVKARDLELARRGGTWPARLDWQGEDRPALRALHGIARNLFRSGRTEEAAKAFRALLKLDPEDAQGVKFMLDDIEHGRSPWQGDEADAA